jgi:hypothetical protein
MHSDQIRQTWRSILVRALRERYGLTSREARTKVNAWLQAVTQVSYTLTTNELSNPDPNKQRHSSRPPESLIRQQMTAGRRRASEAR